MVDAGNAIDIDIDIDGVPGEQPWEGRERPLRHGERGAGALGGVPARFSDHSQAISGLPTALDDRNVLRQEIRRPAERLELYFPRFGRHSFRRRNLTLSPEEGARANEAQAGHSRPAMTSEYCVVGLDRRETTVRRAPRRPPGGLRDEERRSFQPRTWRGIFGMTIRGKRLQAVEKIGRAAEI